MVQDPASLICISSKSDKIRSENNHVRNADGLTIYSKSDLRRSLVV